jgi:DNA-binding protein HU-beta
VISVSLFTKKLKINLNIEDKPVTKGLVEEGKVALTGFLTFEKKMREERTARNPQTGETITIPARNAVTVKVGSKLKEAVK